MRTSVGASAMVFLAAGGLMWAGAGVRGSEATPMGTRAPINPSLFDVSGMDESGFSFSQHVRGSRADVYRMMTTSEGFKAFMGVEAEVDLAIGGKFELYFGRPLGLPLGQQGSEGCQVLSYVPNELLSFSWNAPPTIPAERERRSWVVVTFADGSEGGTDVRLTHLGFGSGGRWPEVRGYFLSAWPKVLGALAAHFEGQKPE